MQVWLYVEMIPRRTDAWCGIIDLYHVYHNNTFWDFRVGISEELSKTMTNVQQLVVRRLSYLCSLVYNNMKKSLKISKGQSEAVNWRKVDNAIVKGKRTEEQTMIY